MLSFYPIVFFHFLPYALYLFTFVSAWLKYNGIYRNNSVNGTSNSSLACALPCALDANLTKLPLFVRLVLILAFIEEILLGQVLYRVALNAFQSTPCELLYVTPRLLRVQSASASASVLQQLRLMQRAMVTVKCKKRGSCTADKPFVRAGCTFTCC